MTPILLMKAIQDFLQTELAHDVTTVPAVHLGYLPQKNADTIHKEEFPFIIVRPQEGVDAMEGTKATILLLFATKSEDNEGFLAVLNLMERVRIKLLKKRVLDGKFRLELPFKWKFYDEQAHPEWFGEATTVWTMPSVQEEVDYGC